MLLIYREVPKLSTIYTAPCVRSNAVPELLPIAYWRVILSLACAQRANTLMKSRGHAAIDFVPRGVVEHALRYLAILDVIACLHFWA